jgi:hypothetical protein
MPMPTRVTLADCSAKIGDYLEQRITHGQLVEWAGAAMLAEQMPPHEQQAIMDLLQDLCRSTPKSLANAAKNYHRMTSPLVRGMPHLPGLN